MKKKNYYKLTRDEGRGTRDVVKNLCSYVPIFLLFLTMSLCPYVTMSLHSAFEELNIGARPQGMGGAFTALADDVNALFYNPAGLALLRNAEFTSNYGRLFMGLDDNSTIGSSFVGYAHPLEKYGTPGISWYTLTLSGLYNETAISLSYAYNVSKYLAAGISLKNLSRTFGSDIYTKNAIDANAYTRLEKEGIAGDPVFDGGKDSSVFTGDLGLLYSYSKNVSIGFSAKNISSPDIGLLDEDKIPAVYRAGVAYKSDTYSLSFETVNKEKDINALMGAEKWFIDKSIAIRSGLAIGSRRWRMISAGATLRFDNFSFDYAFLWPLYGIKDTLGTHKLALTIKFGRPRMAEEEKALLQERAAKLRAEAAAKKALLEAEKFQKEAERIKLEAAEKLKEMRLLEAAAKRAKETTRIQERKAEQRQLKVETEKDFKTSMFYYQKRVSQGAEIAERLLLLDKITKKYQNRGIDISDVQKEKASVLRIQRSARSDYNSSISYYRRLKTRGASVDERKTLLLRIIEKYKGKGIDISETRRELKEL